MKLRTYSDEPSSDSLLTFFSVTLTLVSCSESTGRCFPATDSPHVLDSVDIAPVRQVVLPGIQA